MFFFVEIFEILVLRLSSMFTSRGFPMWSFCWFRIGANQSAKLSNVRVLLMYSGMCPGGVQGKYSENEYSVDLPVICDYYGYQKF